MITPIAQRQVLQTAAAEAVRAAQEGGEQVQREAARKQLLDQRRAEDQGSVHQVSSAENLRLEENPRERRGGAQERHSTKAEPEGAEAEPEGPAAAADSHLDLLA